MKFRKVFFVVVLYMFFVGILVVDTNNGSFLFGENKGNSIKANNQNTDLFDNFDLFSDVLSKVNRYYVDKPDEKQLIYNALKGMVGSLDPHSEFMTPEEFKEATVDTKGEFGGLGVVISLKNGILTVVSPIEDTPAWRAGIKAGDQIIKIDGKSAIGISLNEAVGKLRGRKGSKVVITVKRKSWKKPHDITIIRDIIKIIPVKAKTVENGIYYLRITSFNEKASAYTYKYLKKFAKKGIKGLILDLRDNPGGLLNEAIDISDMFIPKGLVVYTKGRAADSNEKYDVSGFDDVHSLNYPMVVLVNGGSASASEIVAGALQDHKRAVLMGTRTFGKGSVQVMIPLQGGAAVKITTARYYTPSGRCIQAKGIEPDIVVYPAEITKTNDSLLNYHESDLKGHLAKVSSQKSKRNTEKLTKEGKELLKKDYQINRAYDLIKGVLIMKPILKK